MHPKAVICMLAGLMPFEHRGSSKAHRARVKRGAVQGEPTLYLKEKSYVATGGDMLNYRPIEWDDIPDALWDTVTDDLIAKVV